jgi:hypothetical protein
MAASCLRSILPAPGMLRSIMNLGLNVPESAHAGTYFVENDRPRENLGTRTNG